MCCPVLSWITTNDNANDDAGLQKMRALFVGRANGQRSIRETNEFCLPVESSPHSVWEVDRTGQLSFGEGYLRDAEFVNLAQRFIEIESLSNVKCSVECTSNSKCNCR